MIAGVHCSGKEEGWLKASKQCVIKHAGVTDSGALTAMAAHGQAAPWPDTRPSVAHTQPDCLSRTMPSPLHRLLMTEAQLAFDAAAGPLCPAQLAAPLLHTVLALPSLQRHLWGGKGVGSQGDGTVQLLCRSVEDQTKVSSPKLCEVCAFSAGNTHCVRRVWMQRVGMTGSGGKQFCSGVRGRVSSLDGRSVGSGLRSWGALTIAFTSPFILHMFWR